MSNLTNAEYAAKKYFELTVHEDCTLMDFLLKEMHGVSRNRVKDLLSTMPSYMQDKLCV